MSAVVYKNDHITTTDQSNVNTIWVGWGERTQLQLDKPDKVCAIFRPVPYDEPHFQPQGTALLLLAFHKRGCELRKHLGYPPSSEHRFCIFLSPLQKRSIDLSQRRFLQFAVPVMDNLAPLKVALFRVYTKVTRFCIASG